MLAGRAWADSWKFPLTLKNKPKWNFFGNEIAFRFNRGFRIKGIRSFTILASFRKSYVRNELSYFSIETKRDLPRRSLSTISLGSIKHPEDTKNKNNSIPTTAAAIQRSRLFDLFVFDIHGNYEMHTLSKPDILQETCLNARDLVILGSGFHRRPRPVMLVRNSAIVLNFDFIRAIVKYNRVYLFHPTQKKVIEFANKLSGFIRGNPYPFLPDEEFGDLSNSSSTCEEPWNNFDVNEDVHRYRSKQNNMDKAHNHTAPFEIDKTNLLELPFELCAFEGILLQVCQTYRNRTLLLSPLIEQIMCSLSTKVINPDILQQLLPMKDTLSQFEIETTMMRNAINDVLQNEDSMLEMLLTAKEENGGEVPERQMHETVEILLENYVSQLVDTSQEAYYLRKRVEGTQNIVQLKLDTFRNRIIHINVKVALVSVALSSGTMLSGLFGANIPNGLENHPMGFYVLCGTSTLSMIFVYWYLQTLLRGSIPRPLNTDTRYSIFNHLDDVQQALATLRKNEPRKHSISRKEFAEFISSRSGVSIDKEDLDLIFNTYDSNKDEALTFEEVNSKITSTSKRFKY